MAKRNKAKVVPRLGPPRNIRKAGPHADKRPKKQERLDREQRELDDLKTIGSWAYDEDE